MTVRFTPPYPPPHRTKSSLLMRFVRGWNSWIHMVFERSYTMKMGEVHTPAATFYIANELPLVQRIMVDEWHDFPKHAMQHEMLAPLIGNSVFSANGKDWEDQRAMVNPAFSHTALSRVFPLMQAAVDDLVMRMRTLDLARPVGIDPLMTHVAADIIFRTMFGRVLSVAEAETIHRAFHRYQRHAQSTSMLRMYGLPTLGFRTRAIRAAARIHAVFAPIVRARVDEHATGGGRDREDILRSLIEARHPDTGAPFTFDKIMEQISTIFLAGHETAASAMTWALYLIAECPPVQAAILAEADVAAEPTGALNVEAMKRMIVTRNVFRETLRLYPPLGFFMRSTSCPVRMRDKDLKANALLVVSPWLIQRNRDNFPNPHGFDPERFDDPEQAQACRHAYLPFGKGPRVCIGAGFAQQEALLVIAGIIRVFRLESIRGDAPEPVSRLTLRPRNGLRLTLSLRA